MITPSPALPLRGKRFRQMSIHPSAVIDPTAMIAGGVDIGAYAVVEERARISAGCSVGSHAVIGSGTILGPNNRIFSHAIIGTPSQDRKHHGQASYVEVGEGNIFREFATVNRATGENQVTRIGNCCLLMAYTHVAHNCVLEDKVELANATQVGGEVFIGEGAKIGGLVGIHQQCRIGAFAMVGACSKVTQDILPYVRADGHPARPRGINRIGLRRNQFPEDAMERIKQAYKTLFLRKLPWEDALDSLKKDLGEHAEIAKILEFIVGSLRHIARPPRREQSTEEING